MKKPKIAGVCPFCKQDEDNYASVLTRTHEPVYRVEIGYAKRDFTGEHIIFAVFCDSMYFLPYGVDDDELEPEELSMFAHKSCVETWIEWEKNRSMQPTHCHSCGERIIGMQNRRLGGSPEFLIRMTLGVVDEDGEFTEEVIGETPDYYLCEGCAYYHFHQEDPIEMAGQIISDTYKQSDEEHPLDDECPQADEDKDPNLENFRKS